MLAEDTGSILVRNRWGALERNLPGLDHGVPNDVSWDDYRYFYERLRADLALPARLHLEASAVPPVPGTP